MMGQLYALLLLAGVAYGIYLAWGLVVLVVTSPPGTVSDALASAKVDVDDEDFQRRRRRRRDDDAECRRGYSWEGED